jgi:hypothetical protein
MCYAGRRSGVEGGASGGSGSAGNGSVGGGSGGTGSGSGFGHGSSRAVEPPTFVAATGSSMLKVVDFLTIGSRKS